MRHTRRPMNGPRPTIFTILVIDDDSGILEMVSELLEIEGHRVLAAASGKDGLAMVRTVRPDLILVDYHMPVMNGLEVVKRLKSDAETQGIPLVALTSGTGHDANALSRAGCIGFIPKPFEPAGFLRVVAEFLNETVGKTRRAGDSRLET
jgi:CheY-like chemotaxis protein